MSAEHHTLDPYPVPKDKNALFVNEPWIIDDSLYFERSEDYKREPEAEKDNIRIYVPIDLNHKAILRRLRAVINRYEEANEDNEFAFSADVQKLISQLEIYDQVWYVRHMPKKGDHSAEARALAADFVKLLEEIPDGCAETFPFEMIDELKEEYGIE